MSFNGLIANNTFTPRLTLTNSLSGSPITMMSQSTGAAPQTIVWPNTAPTTSQVLSVASVSGQIVTLTWAANGGGGLDIAPPKPTLNKPSPTIQK